MGEGGGAGRGARLWGGWRSTCGARCYGGRGGAEAAPPGAPLAWRGCRCAMLQQRGRAGGGGLTCVLPADGGSAVLGEGNDAAGQRLRHLHQPILLGHARRPRHAADVQHRLQGYQGGGQAAWLPGAGGRQGLAVVCALVLGGGGGVGGCAPLQVQQVRPRCRCLVSELGVCPLRASSAAKPGRLAGLRGERGAAVLRLCGGVAWPAHARPPARPPAPRRAAG